jgi:hypothetical protein
MYVLKHGKDGSGGGLIAQYVLGKDYFSYVMALPQPTSENSIRDHCLFVAGKSEAQIYCAKGLNASTWTSTQAWNIDNVSHVRLNCITQAQLIDCMCSTHTCVPVRLYSHALQMQNSCTNTKYLKVKY